jgi:hypothetical protein
MTDSWIAHPPPPTTRRLQCQWMIQRIDELRVGKEGGEAVWYVPQIPLSRRAQAVVVVECKVFGDEHPKAREARVKVDEVRLQLARRDVQLLQLRWELCVRASACVESCLSVVCLRVRVTRAW